MITSEMIDRAAQHLRETQMARKPYLTAWDKTPMSTKQKWLILAEGTLKAALGVA